MPTWCRSFLNILARKMAGCSRFFSNKKVFIRWDTKINHKKWSRDCSRSREFDKTFCGWIKSSIDVHVLCRVQCSKGHIRKLKIPPQRFVYIFYINYLSEGHTSSIKMMPRYILTNQCNMGWLGEWTNSGFNLTSCHIAKTETRWFTIHEA